MKTPEILQVEPQTELSETMRDNERLQDRSTVAAPPLRLAYSIKEAAEILGVSEKSVRRLIIRRLLWPSRALRHLLIPKKEIERFLEETMAR